jgi:hypothetical protein
MTTSPPPSTEVDFYKVLGLTRPVTQAAVRAAHRRRVQECHPDRGGDADEFHAVTVAYKTLIDEERRRAYDASLSGSPSQGGKPLLVPDLIGRPTAGLSDALESIELVPRVVLVAVSPSDQRAGCVVGQLPVPGSAVEAGMAVGVWIAVSSQSSLWYRLAEFAKEVAGHFWVGFLEGAGVSSSRPALPAGPTPSAVQVVGKVGAVAGATARAGVGLGSCLLRLWAFSLGVIITFVLLAVAPPLGAIVALAVLFLTVKSFVSRSRRKQQGLWY